MLPDRLRYRCASNKKWLHHDLMSRCLLPIMINLGCPAPLPEAAAGNQDELAGWIAFAAGKPQRLREDLVPEVRQDVCLPTA